MATRMRPYVDPEAEDLPLRDQPYESFGQQGYAMPDHVADPNATGRGVTRVELGRTWSPSSDERIEDEVRGRLTEDGGVDATEIEVTVSDGLVTLAGTTPDREQRARAEALIETVRGVRDVTNRIRAKGR